MNHKQKLGYMALGAGILALGIIIGQWGTPDIEAQSNGVFDEITCRELQVVDKDGNKAIGLVSSQKNNGIVIYNEYGDSAIDLISFFKAGNKIAIYNVSNSNKVGVGLSTSDKLGNGVSVSNYYGKTKVWLSVDETGNSINIMDWGNKIKWSAP